MSRSRTGIVVGKDFRPPEGAVPDDWCYLIVDISEEDRIAVRLHRSQVRKAGLGDRVSFREPRGRNRRVARIDRL